MKHTHSLRLLGVASGILVSMGAYALDSTGQPPFRPTTVQRALAAAAPPKNAGDGQLGMALLAARVNANGSLVNGSGAVSSQEFTAVGVIGGYEVIFNRDVTGCFYNAAPHDINAAAFVSIQPRLGAPTGVFLRFRDKADVGRKTEFYVTIYCAR